MGRRRLARIPQELAETPPLALGHRAAPRTCLEGASCEGCSSLPRLGPLLSPWGLPFTPDLPSILLPSPWGLDQAVSQSPHFSPLPPAGLCHPSPLPLAPLSASSPLELPGCWAELGPGCLLNFSGSSCSLAESGDPPAILKYFSPHQWLLSPVLTAPPPHPSPTNPA